jgi:hypothetical protein
MSARSFLCEFDLPYSCNIFSGYIIVTATTWYSHHLEYDIMTEVLKSYSVMS